MKSLRWHDAVFDMMRGLRSSTAPSLCQAIRDLAILVSPPMDRRVDDGSGAVRYYSEVVRGPLPAGGTNSTIAIGRVIGPTVYDLMSPIRSKDLDLDVAKKLKFDLTLDLASLTAIDQALFARFADLTLPSEDQIHRSYLAKAMNSFEIIASTAYFGTDGRSARLIGQSLAKLVKSIDIRVNPTASANVGVRSDPAPRNWVFDSGDADIGLDDLPSTDERSRTRPMFRRFPDRVRRIDVPTTVGYGLYFEDSVHLTEFHWAGFDTDQKTKIRFVGDLVREMLLLVFARPHDYSSIADAECMALDIDTVLRRNRSSWTPRVRKRYERWSRLNTRNYEIGGFMRKLRQVELNLAYRNNIIQKLRRAKADKAADEDLQDLIELETVGYLKSCANEIHELGDGCGISIDELNALSDALGNSADALSAHRRGTVCG